jgi:hypothetical protein
MLFLHLFLLAYFLTLHRKFICTAYKCVSSVSITEGYDVADGNSLLLSFHYLVHLHVVTVKIRVTLVQAVHGISAGYVFTVWHEC